jgi:protein farnesyltransferase subunit beta
VLYIQEKGARLMVSGQTFEGGIAARPDAEAHGAYAFLAVASLCILGEPHVTIPK